MNCSQARLITRSPLSFLQTRSAYFAYYKLATHPAGHQLRLLCLPVPSWTIRLCPFRGTVLCNLWPSAATCDCACVRVYVCECGAPAAGRDFAYLLWQPHADECVQCRGGSGFNFQIIFRCKIASPVYPAVSSLPSHTTRSNNSGNNCKQFMRLGLDNFRLNDMQAPWRRTLATRETREQLCHCRWAIKKQVPDIMQPGER